MRGYVPGNTIDGFWHILGAALIEHAEKHYLCALDGNSYFVSELPCRVKTVVDAFECLKPEPVHRAEKEGKSALRQGEWFFVPTGLDDKGMAKKFNLTQKALLVQAAVSALPRIDESGNQHQCLQFKSDDGICYARGKVFHRPPNGEGLTREHATVNLGDQWYEVWKNTEIRSWSQHGQFD
jgi:hypothetical protein